MSENIQSPPRKLGGVLAGGGLFTGLASLVGASCCVLPLLLVQLGVSAALVAHLDVFARAKPYLMAATAILAGCGFIAAFWGGRRPRRGVLLLLAGAAILVLASIALPYFEDEILRLLPAR